MKKNSPQDSAQFSDLGNGLAYDAARSKILLVGVNSPKSGGKKFDSHLRRQNEASSWPNIRKNYAAGQEIPPTGEFLP